jgi:hypothetical protein
VQVETDFTSKRHTLSFESGKRIELTKEESDELDDWYCRKLKENK